MPLTASTLGFDSQTQLTDEAVLQTKTRRLLAQLGLSRRPQSAQFVSANPTSLTAVALHS